MTKSTFSNAASRALESVTSRLIALVCEKLAPSFWAAERVRQAAGFFVQISIVDNESDDYHPYCFYF